MGQILVGGATTLFPDLRLAFFVGDVLIKRDCRRLQELAPNVNIVKYVSHGSPYIPWLTDPPVVCLARPKLKGKVEL